jgi:hypothetical protein
MLGPAWRRWVWLGKTALGGADLGSVLCILSMEDQGDRSKIAMLEL